MGKKVKQQIDYDRPVAYDANGRPLFAHPTNDIKYSSKSKKSTDENKPRIGRESPEKQFTGIELCDDEYVISSAKRHLIGLSGPFIVAIIIITLLFSALFNFKVVLLALGAGSRSISFTSVLPPLLFTIILVIISAYITYFVYVSNRLILTNKSIHQTIQIGLFSKHEQTVSLGNIEDASYTQTGILQQILNYGAIRLSTIGDEHTYELTYVINPKTQITTINKAINSFKNNKTFLKN